MNFLAFDFVHFHLLFSGPTLLESCKSSIYLERTTSSITVGELCDRIAKEFDRRLKNGESSQRHFTSMRETLKKFRTKFEAVPIRTLEGTTIKAWLATELLALKTRNRHFGYIKNIFGIAREWNLVNADPFERVPAFNDSRDGRKIEILTPEEMTRFLSAVDRDWLPFFAISAFTGLRSDEVSKLDWAEIKLDRSLIDLPFSKSKNGKRKLEEVPENLLEILSPFVRTEGRVKPQKKLQNARESAAALAGLTPWKQNCLRHSFCSYAVAIKGIDWTAIQADHDTKMLKKYYLEVVTKEDANRYWAIRL